jgi:hypothetical protein
MSGGFYMKRIIDEDNDEGIEHYLFDGTGRLIVDTIHGRICIDIRGEDVNAFTLDKEHGRTNFLLIPKKED